MGNSIKNKTTLVVGAGFSGATIANLIATKANEKVIIIDKRNHIAGNCFDFRDNNGIMIHKYGSHIFHTNFEKVWTFIKQFADFNTYMHKVIGIVDGIETHIPFNFNTLYDVFPVILAKKLEEKLLNYFDFNTKVSILEFKKLNDKDLNFLGNYVYEKIFLYYTLKQWGMLPDKINSSVLERVPVFLSKDNRYFQDKYQGIPNEGYTKVVEKMLSNENIEVLLNTEFKNIEIAKFDKIFYTGSIDEYFNYELGQLPYRSVKFKFETYDKFYYQSNACINYPCNYDFTRIHEYKYYLNDKTNKTVIAKEYSELFELEKNDRYYPIPNEENINLYKKYLEKAKKKEKIYFLGRLGDYQYYNMDKAILRAIELFEKIYSLY